MPAVWHTGELLWTHDRVLCETRLGRPVIRYGAGSGRGRLDVASRRDGAAPATKSRNMRGAVK